jgi:hypothetical protein
MRRRFVFAPALLLLASASARPETPPPVQWVAVTAPAFRTALEPLCAHRKAQGMRVVVVTTTDVLGASSFLNGDAAPLRDHVARLCRDYSGMSQVLLLGAVEASSAHLTQQIVVPPLPGSVGRMKNQPSDNGYGCPLGDLLPTVAVGRLPARTDSEARAMIQKTLEQERDTRPGDWRRRLTVLAGAPEFNPLVDALVERAAIAQLARIDSSWHGRAIYLNPQSRFTLPDHLCQARARALVEEGQALTLYLGHSSAQGFYAKRSRYLDRDDWAELVITRGRGVFATFGCNGCQLTGRDGEGYGVAAVRNPQGPAAVLGSHGICFAAMVKLASEAFTDSILGPHPPECLGASWLRLKQGLARDSIDPITFRLLDLVDGDSTTSQDVQRQEHLEMFVLLGDPALRLPSLPADVALTVAGLPAAGDTIIVKGTAPPRLEGARVRLTINRPRDSDPPGVLTLPKGPAASRARAIIERHEQANNFTVVKQETAVKDGHFEATCELPVALPWRCLIVQAYLATDQQEGLQVLTLNIHSPLPARR